MLRRTPSRCRALVVITLLCGATAAAQSIQPTNENPTAPASPEAGPPPRETEGAGGGADAASDISKRTQNPVADIISIPIRNDVSFGLPGDRVQSLFRIQPVLPLRLFPDVNLILRTIFPFYSQPVGTTERASGMGDIQVQIFISPKDSGAIIWGVGPVVYLPTATDAAIASEKFGLGGSAVVLVTPGPWVIGALATYIASVAGNPARPSINLLDVQYFANYNLPQGWSVGTAPDILLDFSRSSDRWTVPFGLLMVKTFLLSTMALQVQFAGYYNAVRPDSAPRWLFRTQFSIVLPQGKK
jgi:hypothetical protein